MKRILLILTILLYCGTYAGAQDKSDSTTKTGTESIYHDWYNKSPIDDQIFGAEVDKAYELLLQDKKSTTIIVAVIDGGIDFNHEDLKDNMWVNKDEIPGNEIDDDNNGYIDDIYGWNFLGNSKSENISYENLEITRIYRQYNDKYGNGKPGKLSEEEEETYELYKAAKKIYEKQLKQATFQRKSLENYKNKYYNTLNKISKVLNKTEITVEDLENLKEHNKELKKDIKFLYPFIKYDFDPIFFDKLEEPINEELDYHLNVNFNPRDIIGDDINDITEYYGNNNVYGPEADHGTFVAGIIAAERNNEIGINGIADNVQIMALKAVPNGDELDKDVAKAIRYAVDNGARIINMSFGKELSPQKHLVDEAILYAQEKGVLLVHAAGNESLNLDKEANFPTKTTKQNVSVSNWVTVGASSIINNLKFAAYFTNYGKNSVDIFAPGVQVKSLVPENEYDIADGTSFSSPVVSGVAALILSYYPELTAEELKNVILKSSLVYKDTDVYKPGNYSRKGKKIEFGSLSSTGGIVSAYEALKLAEEMSK
ncbi:S8 family serine peptidase [Bacteroidota bacterium]